MGYPVHCMKLGSMNPDECQTDKREKKLCENCEFARMWPHMSVFLEDSIINDERDHIKKKQQTQHKKIIPGIYPYKVFFFFFL